MATQILPDIKVDTHNGATTGTSDVTTAILDMQGYDGVLIIGRIATGNAGNFLKAQQGQQVGGGDMADLAGSRITLASNNMAAVLDVNKPADRYVRGVLVRAGATTVAEILTTIRYKASKKPTINDVATILAAKGITGAAEGTP